MKAIIEFNLPEDQEDYEIFSKASEMRRTLEEIENTFRTMEKHKNVKSIKISEVRKIIRDEILYRVGDLF